RHRFILVVLDDQLQHHKKKLNALKHLTSGRKNLRYHWLVEWSVDVDLRDYCYRTNKASFEQKMIVVNTIYWSI
ncbi:hypothetical protein, partial [Leuconostoc citreum]|uniref:hypothetical protein n=1 Tax=Leuconostoc citreum TaxID=33964 RepID=UPI0021A7BEC2